MRKPNKILAAGMAVVGLTLILKHFNAGLPDFAEGFMLGVGLALELAGIFGETHGTTKFRNLKMRLFNRLSGRNSA